MSSQTKIINEVAGIKTVITTMANGKRIYRTILPHAKNYGAAGTPHLAKIIRK